MADEQKVIYNGGDAKQDMTLFQGFQNKCPDMQTRFGRISLYRNQNLPSLIKICSISNVSIVTFN